MSGRRIVESVTAGRAGTPRSNRGPNNDLFGGTVDLYSDGWTSHIDPSFPDQSYWQANMRAALRGPSNRLYVTSPIQGSQRLRNVRIAGPFGDTEPVTFTPPTIPQESMAWATNIDITVTESSLPFPPDLTGDGFVVLQFGDGPFDIGPFGPDGPPSRPEFGEPGYDPVGGGAIFFPQPGDRQMFTLVHYADPAGNPIEFEMTVLGAYAPGIIAPAPGPISLSCTLAEIPMGGSPSFVDPITNLDYYL